MDKIIGSNDEDLENKNHNQDESNNSSSAESSWTPPKGKPVNDSQDESSANSTFEIKNKIQCKFGAI